jgi:two-component system sensor histidine kinase CreC
MRLWIVGAGAIALILFVAFVVARLIRSRTAGISIRMQVFLALASIVGAFALGLGVLVVDRVEARATLLAEESARGEATVIAALFEGELEERGRTFDEVAVQLARAQGQLNLVLTDAAGKVVMSSGSAPGTPRTVAVTVPILAGGAIVGHVRVVKPTIVIQRMLEDFSPIVVVTSVVLGAAAAAAAAVIGRAIATPIETLTDYAVRVSEGERGKPPPAGPGREVQRLAHSFESMRRELEGRPFVETFAADLSHELKNPVAAVRASAEVLADGALDEPEEARRFVNRILEATMRIQALLDDLLSLARMEARGVEGAKRVDLGQLAREVASRMSDPDREILAIGTATIKGDPTWLARAVDNLVENAIVHGAEGPVRIEVRREGDGAVVEVSNGGAVAKHVKERLFRRFVTTRADRGGTGLGLAIVRAVAEAHGGTADCASSGPIEVRFRMHFPPA